MAHYCEKCGTKTIFMTGAAYLTPFKDPQKSKTKITGFGEIVQLINAHFCENCGNITLLINK